MPVQEESLTVTKTKQNKTEMSYVLHCYHSSIVISLDNCLIRLSPIVYYSMQFWCEVIKMHWEEHSLLLFVVIFEAFHAEQYCGIFKK